MEEKSLDKVFAIIDPETDEVVALTYSDDNTEFYRSASAAKWFELIDFPASEHVSLEGNLVPVEDTFIEVFDRYVLNNEDLYEEDAEQYLRDAEF